jgi:drug/metabolite transporter (DMT)-like permease
VTAAAEAPSPQRERGQGAGIAAIVLALVSFSFGFVIVKALDLEAGPIALWRLAIGAGFLVVVAAVLRVPWPRRLLMPGLAGVAFGVHQLLYIEATQRTSIAIVTLVGAMQPLVVAMASRRTVGERVPPALLACSALAVAGVGIVVWASIGQAERTLLGDVLSIANLFAFTAYFLLTKRARQQGAPTLTLTASLLLVALVVVAPVALLGGGRLALAPVELGLIALLALGPGNGHLLVNWAHERVSAALASLILAAVPVLAALWAYLILGEAFGPRHMVGMAVVVAASEAGRRVERRERLRLLRDVPTL